jgi:hypothetical protein
MLRCSKFTRIAVLAAAVALSSSCGSVVRNGSSPVYLVIDSLEGSRGASTPGAFTSGLLISDVITNVTTPAPCTTETPCPTIFGDTGQAVLRASLKNIGTPTAPSVETTNNEVTITRYHVEYTRTDGHNVQGVDVPFAFDGGATGTIPAGGSLTLGFELVRNIAKQESPLIQLESSSVIIQAIANVTFYGQDQVGNQVNVTGSISVEFGNFGDLQ